MAIKLPKFVDLAPERPKLHGCFGSTNEDVGLHKRLLGRIDGNLGRVASICSGGEVPLLALLSKAKEVIAVDHAYQALGWTYMKLILLQTIGLSGLKALLEPEHRYGMASHTLFQQNFREKLDFTWHYLPPALVPHLERQRHTLNIEDYIQMRSCWPSVTQEEADFIVDNCDRLTLCHGDFTDCEGPFDLLYISNMLGHTSQKFNAAPPVDHLIKMLKPGGYILGTNPEVLKEHESVIKDVSGVEIQWKESTYSHTKKYIVTGKNALQSKGWTHTLHQLEATA